MNFQIYAFLFDLAEANSSVCEVIKIGMSYEGRDLLVLKIASGGTSPKPIIWLDSREFFRSDRFSVA